MADLFLLTTLLVAFAGLVGLVRVCDRIVGDDPPATAPDPSASEEPVAAGSAS